MTENKTLGQIACDAYWQAEGCKPDDEHHSWKALCDAGDKHGMEMWEAVGTAVRRWVIGGAILTIKELSGKPDQLKLHMGELSAQEIRTLKSALGSLVPYYLRSLLPTKDSQLEEERSSDDASQRGRTSPDINQLPEKME